MSAEAAKHIGEGIAWLGFWLAVAAVLVVAILILLLVIGVQGCTRNKKICIAEKTIAEIVSVSRHETTVKYTDGTFQRVSTLNGATVGDVKCLAYQ